jgi:hypothetical protein
MNKLTTAALAGLVAVTATVNASVSRRDGFGSIGAAFIADVQDIWTLPGAIVNYKDALYAELGGSSYSSDVWGGAHFELGNGVLGVWGNRPVNEGGNMNQWVPSWGTPGSNPNESIDIIYGFNLSDDTTIAAGINRASWSEIDKTKEVNNEYYDEESAGTLGLSLGLEQKNVGPIALLEVGLQFNTVSQAYTDKTTLPTADEDKVSINGTDIDLRIGGDMAGDDGRFSRVELGLNMDSASAKNEPMPVPAAGSHVENKYSGFGYNVGYAAGKSGEKGMGLVGLMLSSRSDVEEEVNSNDVAGGTYKRAYSLFQLTAGFAAEGKVNSWLTFRGGLTTNVLHNTTRERTRNNTVTGEEVHTNSTTDYGNWFDLYGGQNGTASFGTSMTFGNLTIDGVLDQDLLWDGPYLVTGAGSGGLNTNVSATWVY